MTGSFGRHLDKYIFKGKDHGKMYICINREDLSILKRMLDCAAKLYDLLMEDVKNNPHVPPFQWGDTVFIGMVTKLKEEPLFVHFPKLRDIITAAMMSWPPCKDEDD